MHRAETEPQGEWNNASRSKIRQKSSSWSNARWHPRTLLYVGRSGGGRGVGVYERSKKLEKLRPDDDFGRKLGTRTRVRQLAYEAGVARLFAEPGDGVNFCDRDRHFSHDCARALRYVVKDGQLAVVAIVVVVVLEALALLG
eukprot:6202016-Pleurochrysis_carterae.AAC.1